MIAFADLFPLAPEQRPENRRRRDEPPHAPPWEPPRSEAFFEDLDTAPELPAAPAPPWALPLAA